MSQELKTVKISQNRSKGIGLQVEIYGWDYHIYYPGQASVNRLQELLLHVSIPSIDLLTGTVEFHWKKVTQEN